MPTFSGASTPLSQRQQNLSWVNKFLMRVDEKELEKAKEVF
jgi:hypothetical protein